MSWKKLGIINPDEELFSGKSKRRNGKIFDFERHPPDSSSHVDASDVFKNILNVDTANGKCNGTAFRFVLRREASKLSKTIYDKRRVRQLFKSFIAEGHLALIFLKNLARIEFYIRKNGSDQAELLSAFSITQESGEKVREKERRFMDDVKNASRSSYPVNKHLVHEVSIKSYFKDGISERTESSKYIIVHYYGGKLLDREQNHISEKQAKSQGFIPLVGVAYQRSENKVIDGHIFCALPLPVIEKKSTGLPVHINGYFALGSDRKDLKWPSVEQSTSSDKEVSWNLFLLQRVLPAAYKKLFEHLTMDDTEFQIVYNSFPDVNEVDSKWRKLADEVLSKIFRCECLWNYALSEWISPEDACVTDESRKGYEGAGAFLQMCSYPVVCISEHVMHGMNNCSVEVEVINPKKLRDVIIENYDKMGNLEFIERMDILLYALEDPSDIDFFCNVPVLPLEDGRFACPQSSKGEPLFMTSNDHPIDLVPGCKKYIIKTDIQESLKKMIKEIAEKCESYFSTIIEIII